jgi:Zn finger protein HypA/HybF involved in hydrogenase expression
MFCQTKDKVRCRRPFCRVCGRSTSVTEPVTFNVTFNKAEYERKTPAFVRCKSCGYEGRSEFARSIPLQVIAWICLFVFLPFTIIYFLTTKKYRCPKCKSTFLSIKNKEGEFVG